MDSFLYCVALVSFVPMPLIFIASIYPRKKKSPARTLVQKGMHLIKNVLSLYHYLYIVLPWHLVSYLFYKKHVIKALQKAMRYIQKKQVHKAILHYKKGLKHLSIGNPLLAPLVVICQHIGKLLCDEGKDLKAAHHYKEAILFNKNCNVLSPSTCKDA